jgi:hypothetical protein
MEYSKIKKNKKKKYFRFFYNALSNLPFYKLKTNNNQTVLILFFVFWYWFWYRYAPHFGIGSFFFSNGRNFEFLKSLFKLIKL